MALRFLFVLGFVALVAPCEAGRDTGGMFTFGKRGKFWNIAVMGLLRDEYIAAALAKNAGVRFIMGR